MSERDPIPATDLTCIRAADAVLDAALAWEQRLDGRPLSDAERRLCEAVRVMREKLKEAKR